jgi:hypothetical protein
MQVMGLLQGKVQGDSFVVIDSFALPVEGTETRVNAQAEAYEYMVDFQGTSKVRFGWLLVLFVGFGRLLILYGGFCLVAGYGW